MAPPMASVRDVLMGRLRCRVSRWGGLYPCRGSGGEAHRVVLKDHHHGRDGTSRVTLRPREATQGETRERGVEGGGAELDRLAASLT